MTCLLSLAVVFIGKGGYWEGRAGGRLGWFPARAIQEITEDVDSGVYVEPRACEYSASYRYMYSYMIYAQRIRPQSCNKITSFIAS